MRTWLITLLIAFIPATAFAGDPPVAPKTEVPTSQPTTPDEPPPLSDAALLATADAIAAKVAKIRGLAVKAPVKKGIKRREELRAVLLQKLTEEVSEDDIKAEAAVYKRLGLIPADMDYKKMLLDVLTEQVAGFYDQKSKELYVMQGIPLSMQRPAMAHELFHAIQDQHFQIEELQKPFATTENSDFAMSRSALLEGDATVLMFDFEMYEDGRLPDGNQTSLVDNPMMANILSRLDFNMLTAAGGLLSSMGGAGFSIADTALAKAPRVFREMLVFPYFAGMRFIVMSRNQRTWKDVDEIYANPPVSTEQILHPERYYAGDEPEWLAFDTGPALRGWTRIYDSVLGEFQLLQFLKEHPAPGVDPAAAAMGWDGDRVFAFQSDTGETALAVMSSWDSVGEAREFYDAAVAISKHRYPKALIEGANGEHGQSTCLVRNGPDVRERVYIEQWGDLVLYVEGTPSKLDANGKELNSSTHLLREHAWKSLTRRPLGDVIRERLAAGVSAPGKATK